jgi:MEDS: MEthanogen/methylotroph, DcmR Sensory domain
MSAAMTSAESAHFVQFFDTDARLIETVSSFVRDSLESGCTCVVVATGAHRAAIAARLESLGLDAAAYAAAYRYISVAAALTLQKFMLESGPDPQRFHQNVGLLLRQAAASGRPVHVYGEMVGLLAERGQMAALIRLEELWNELSRYHTFRLFCGYPETPFATDERSRARVCATHAHVVQTR